MATKLDSPEVRPIHQAERGLGPDVNGIHTCSLEEIRQISRTKEPLPSCFVDANKLLANGFDGLEKNGTPQDGGPIKHGNSHDRNEANMQIQPHQSAANELPGDKPAQVDKPQAAQEAVLKPSAQAETQHDHPPGVDTARPAVAGRPTTPPGNPTIEVGGAGCQFTIKPGGHGHGQEIVVRPPKKAHSNSACTVSIGPN
jgi:hypothetical protein